MALVEFDSIKSIDDQDGVWGADELSLTVDGEEVWQSVGVNSGEKFNLEALDPISISDSSTVKLLEDDLGFAYNKIGSFTPVDKADESPIELNQADGIYEVAFTVI